VKLAAFAATVAVVAGLAALAGAAVGPLDVAEPEPAGHGGDMLEEAGHAPAPVRGLAVSEDGLTLRLERAAFPRGQERELAFRVVDAKGATVRDFEVEHERRMHVIVVRRDLTGFQHVHPVQRVDGSWSVPLTLPDPGAYRVFADFHAGGEAHTLAGDLMVDGDQRTRPLPAPATETTVDGLRVRLESGASRAGTASRLAFTVTRDGRPVEVQPYLGAMGHLVALRQGDLAFLHVHPDEDRLAFTATFPDAAAHRLFLQFKVDGTVHTAAFTREVGRA